MNINYIAIVSILIPTGALASSASIQFDATVDDSCTVVATQTGSINLNGQIITTEIPAQASISNNAAGAFNVSIQAPTSFSIKPTNFNGNASTQASYSLSGQNIRTSVQGTTTLANSGTDTLSLSLTGSTNHTFLPGTYQLMAVVSCDAI